MATEFVVGSPRQPSPAGDGRQHAIMQAALELFYQRGFHAVSVRDIATRAGMSVSLLYHYFPSKDALLQELLLQSLDLLLQRVEAALQAAAAEPPLTRLRQAVLATVLQCLEEPARASLHATDYRAVSGAEREAVRIKMKTYERLLEGVIAEGVRSGQCMVADVTMAAFFIMTACFRVTTWYHADGRLSREAIAGLYADMAVRLLAA